MTDVGDIDRRIRGSARPRGWEIARLADRQHGVVGFRQLRGLGLGADAIQHRLSNGSLHPVHEGVYAVGHRRVSLEGRWMAAVLACGSTALLSHRDAAQLWGLLRGAARDIDVTTARRCRGRPRVALHRSRRIHPDDRAVRDGIPVTSVARTLLDLAEVVSQWRLSRAIEEAERRGVLDLGAVERLIARGIGRHGLRPLRNAMARYRPAPFTRSELERRFIELCRRARLPEPSANLWIAGGEADMAWPDCGLVVELDTRAHHATDAAFERDRARDADLQLAGYRVLRVTDRRLEQQPEDVLQAVRTLLGR